MHRILTAVGALFFLVCHSAGGAQAQAVFSSFPEPSTYLALAAEPVSTGEGFALQEAKAPTSPWAKKQLTLSHEEESLQLKRRYTQSADRMRSAELEIDAKLRDLLRYREQFPEAAPEIDNSIAQLRNLLLRIRELNQHVQSLQTDVQPQMDPSAGLENARHAVSRTEQLEGQVQAEAAQASQIADATISRLSQPATAGSEYPAGKKQKKKAPSQSVETSPSPQPPTVEPLPPPPPQIAYDVIPSPPPKPAPSKDAESEWFAKLQKGLLQYHVPASMKWKVASTVTVVIGGSKAAPSKLPDQTGSASIQVSRRMRVVVFCPDNPDEFIITPQTGTQEVQYVPEDSTTTWNWSVTPRYTGDQKKIVIRAWVIYPDSLDIQRELPVYTAVVNVHVPSVGECVKRLVQGDPDYWLKYGLPGGAGFAFVSVAAAWLRRQFAKKDTHTTRRIKTAT